MTHRLRVRNLTSEELTDAGDLFVYCIGFERRSRFFAEVFDPESDRVVAVKYSSGQILSFCENLKFAEDRKFRLVSDVAGQVESALTAYLHRLRSSGCKPVVTVDVSAMDRSIMARILLATINGIEEGEQLRIVYAPAEFRQPDLNLLPIRRIGAVHADLAGEVSGPDMGRALLLGLGYEYGVSLHVLDAHEPDISFIFRPIGFDERFASSVKEANFGFDFGERNYEIIDYHLSDVAALYDEISRLVVAMKHDTAVVGVPLGPKILSAIMILVGIVHRPRLSVLRYSMASTDFHRDVDAARVRTGIVVTRAGRSMFVD